MLRIVFVLIAAVACGACEDPDPTSIQSEIKWALLLSGSVAALSAIWLAGKKLSTVLLAKWKSRTPGLPHAATGYSLTVLIVTCLAAGAISAAVTGALAGSNTKIERQVDDLRGEVEDLNGRVERLRRGY